MTILRRSFKLRYSMPPSSSLSLSDRFLNNEFRPTVTCRDKNGMSFSDSCGCCCEEIDGRRWSRRAAAVSPRTNNEVATPATRSIDLLSVMRGPSVRRRRTAWMALMEELRDRGGRPMAAMVRFVLWVKTEPGLTVLALGKSPVELYQRMAYKNRQSPIHNQKLETHTSFTITGTRDIQRPIVLRMLFRRRIKRNTRPWPLQLW